ncbi:hypothetical protein Ancab_025499 [Ancistrocladus abbreviatus]
MLGMVQPPQVAQTSEPPQLPAQKVQQTNTSIAESLPSLAEQANSFKSQIPVRKHQQNQSSTPTLSSPVKAPGSLGTVLPTWPTSTTKSAATLAIVSGKQAERGSP